MQTIFRGNLSAANFPLVSEFMGRSIVVPQLDQNYQRNNQFSGTDGSIEKGIPQVYYCHNVMPVEQGFKSIAYKVTVRPAVGVANFSRTFVAKDSAENKAIIGITETGGVYIYSAGQWVNITAQAGGWTGGTFSYAYANGNTYLCLSKFQTYKIDIIAQTLTIAPFTGILTAGIVALTSSNNYLIATDDITVYWSSAINPEDFVPSLVTGSGSGVPQDINGKIIAVLPMGNGFAIYTTTNIILAAYSGNIRYPWIFKAANNGAGILKVEHVADDGDAGTNYAWTSSGLLKITATGCIPQFPEVSDFLSGRIFEDYDSTADTFNAEYLLDQMNIKIAFVGSRYLVISYGKASTPGNLTQALVYDTAFKRMGKLRLNHVACFELGVDSESPLTFTQLADSKYTDYATVSFTELTALSSFASKAKRNFAFLQADGTIKLAVWDYGNYNADAVLILGKYQLVRSMLSTLEGIELEDIDSANSNIAVKILTTLDGKTIVGKATPNSSLSVDKLKKYDCHIAGANHSIVVKGAFNLISTLIILSKSGRR